MIIQYKLLRTTGRVIQYELDNYGSMLKVNRQCEIGSLVVNHWQRSYDETPRFE